jgi:hypothetical protein
LLLFDYLCAASYDYPSHIPLPHANLFPTGETVPLALASIITQTDRSGRALHVAAPVSLLIRVFKHTYFHLFIIVFLPSAQSYDNEIARGDVPQPRLTFLQRLFCCGRRALQGNSGRDWASPQTVTSPPPVAITGRMPTAIQSG